MIKANNRKLIRSIARMLTAVFLLPHLVLLGATTAVMAQAEGTTNVAVLDFANQSKVGDSLVSRLATDAVVVELTNSNKFSVVTRKQLDEAMSDLDLHPPLSLTDVLRVGEKLSVNSVVVGEIKDVSVTDKPRQARVELSIRLLDAATGEPINGAIARGTSAPRATFTGDDDVLVTEAINNAAYVGVKRMVDYIIPEATVLNAVGQTEVLLNRGAQDGITKGMEMIVSRDNEVIGKIRVRDVSNNDAQAVVVSAVRGVRPQDTARAIFKLPQTAPAGYGEPAAKISGGVIGGEKKGGAGKLLGIVAGIALLAALAGGHKSNGESVGGGITAEAGVAPTLATPSGLPGVRVSLDQRRFGANLLQYKIWRSDQALPVWATAPGAAFVTDYQLATGATAPAFNYMTVDPNSPSTAPASTAGTFTGITPGTTYTYSVSMVYKRILSLSSTDSSSSSSSSSSTTTGSVTYVYEESLPEVAGTVTPLARVTRADMTEPALNATDVDPSSVSFEWKSTLGADTYVLEVAKDPAFRNMIYTSETERPITWSPSSTGEVISFQPNATTFASAFTSAGITSASTIYWRVGAKNSGDRPGPIADSVTGKRLIYGEVSQFKVREEPPAPPGS